MMLNYTAQDLADAFDAGKETGFDEALERVDRYARCITGETGTTCKWFAKNVQAFEVAAEQEQQ